MPNSYKWAFYLCVGERLTGGPQVLINLIQVLDRERISPLVLTQRDGEFTELLAKLGCAVEVESLPEGLEQRGGAALRESAVGKLGRLFDIFGHNRRIYRRLARAEIDGIWVRNIRGVLLTGFAARLRGIPVVWDLGMEQHARGLLHVLYVLGFLLSTVVVAEGPSVYSFTFPKYLRRLFRRKLMVIRSAVSDDRIAEIKNARGACQRDDSQFQILCVASLTARKNQLMLLQAVNRLFHEDANIAVSIVGGDRSDGYAQLLYNYVAEHRLHDVVRFLGWRDDVATLLASHNVFVLCSTNEGVPYSILEAMYAELPIVATRAGGIPDVITDQKSGFLVDVDDVCTLTNQLRQLRDDHRLRLKTGAAAHQYVQRNHSATTWSEQYMQLLDKLSQRRDCHSNQ